jgi:hypothetical protein
VSPEYTRRENQARIFFKIFVDGHRGDVCVFNMDNRHVRSF